MSATITHGENPYKGNIIIPNDVTYNGRTMLVKGIGEKAFQDCTNLLSVKFNDNITNISSYAFQNCLKLKKIEIPSNITSIGHGAFYGCSNLGELIIDDGDSHIRCGTNGSETLSAVFDCRLKSLYIGRDLGNWDYTCKYDLDNSNLTTIIIGRGKSHLSGFSGAQITSLSIPSNVISIKEGAFKGCTKLNTVYFEDGDKDLIWQEAYDTTINATVVSVAPFHDSPIKEAYIGRNIKPTSNNIRFSGSEGPFDRTPVEKITISNKVTILCGFIHCQNISDLTIPSSVNTVMSLNDCNSLKTIRCLNQVPPSVKSYSFVSNNTYINSVLYVPVGSIEQYKNDEKWGKFFNILGADEVNNENYKCSTPSIYYNNGVLSFISQTSNVIFHSTITNNDIKSYIGDSIDLNVTYDISVYASKAGYENSDVAHATLCWIDVNPATEGIESGISNIQARPLIVKAEQGSICIEGLNDKEKVTLFTLDGNQIGMAYAVDGIAYLPCHIQRGAVIIINIGYKSMKIMMN